MSHLLVVNGLLVVIVDDLWVILGLFVSCLRDTYGLSTDRFWLLKGYLSVIHGLSICRLLTSPGQIGPVI